MDPIELHQVNNIHRICDILSQRNELLFEKNIHADLTKIGFSEEELNLLMSQPTPIPFTLQKNDIKKQGFLLTIHAHSHLNLKCQICTKPMDKTDLHIHSHIFVTNSRRVSEQTSQYDTALLSEDYPFTQLLKDEIILNIPLYTRHTKCNIIESSPQENPFLKLKDMMSKNQ